MPLRAGPRAGRRRRRGPGAGAGDLRPARRPARRRPAARLRLAAARIPRGPLPATRANRFGLTARQVDILGLLADGLSNAQIAARLSVSPKTADHHVAAILAKLDVPSRREAAALAITLGLAPDGRPPGWGGRHAKIGRRFPMWPVAPLR